jgi:hypothetical protein
MKRKSITLALMICLTAGTALAGADGHWLHVRVEESDRDGEKINVNIPLSVVMAILPAIETDDFRGGRINIGRGQIDDIDLHQILQAFKDSPDAQFVTIEGSDESVSVSKERGFLLVDVDDDGDSVRVRLPLDVVDALLGGHDDELDLVAALGALADHGGGDLVTVDSDDETIRVWIDTRAGGK